MNQPGDIQQEAEQAFQDYLDLCRLGQIPNRQDFIHQYRSEIQTELTRMLEDYSALRKQLKGSLPHLEPGKTLGEYRLVQQLGKGGMGEVWEAEQISFQRKVALKLLHPQHSLSQVPVRRFAREAQAGGRITHQNIVRTYAFGEAAGIHFIAQELVPGGITLADRIAEWRSGEETPHPYYRWIAEFFASVADALQAAHDSGIIHRDLKPSNLLVTPEDQPKVADFGLAMVEGDLALSKTGDLLGTYYYISPEQALSKRVDLDHRTDIFSLGSTFYEALTFNRAFDGDTSKQILEKITVEDPPDPSEFRSQIPRDLITICLKCLEKARAKRYGDMADLAADLRRYLHNEPILARPSSIWIRAQKWVRRHPLLASTSMITTISAVLLGVLLWVALDQKQLAFEQTQIAEESRLEAQEKSYMANIRACDMSREYENYAEAHFYLNLCAKDQRGVEWDYLDLATDASELTLTGAGHQLIAFSLHPHKALVTTLTNNSILQTWNSRSGELLNTSKVEPYLGDHLEITKDGTRFLTADIRKTIYLLDVSKGTVQTRLEGHTKHIEKLNFFNQDNWIWSTSADSTLRVWDAINGQEIHRFAGAMSGVKSVTAPRDGRALFFATRDNEIFRWDLSAGASDPKRLGLLEDVRALQLSPDASFLAAASRDRLHIWTQGNWQNPRQIEVNHSPITCLTFAPEEPLLYCGTLGGEIQVISLKTGEPIRRLQGPPSCISLVLSDNGRKLAANSANKSGLYLWDTRTWEFQGSLAGHEQFCKWLAFDSQTNSFWTCSHDNTVRRWHLETRRIRQCLHVGGDGGNFLSALADGGRTIGTFTGTSKGKILFWHGDSSGLRATGKTRHDGPVRDLAIDADGRLLASTGTDTKLLLWDIATAESIRTIPLPSRLEVISFDMRSNWLAGAGTDARTYLFDLRNDFSLRVLKSEEERPTLLHFSRFNTSLFVGGKSGIVREFDLQNGEVLNTYMNPLEGQFAVLDVALSPDENRLAWLLSNENLLLWDMRTQKQISKPMLQGARSMTSDLSFHPDGQRLVSHSLDGSLRIWNAQSGYLLLSIPNSFGSISTAIFSKEGDRILAGSRRGLQLCIWETNRKHALRHSLGFLKFKTDQEFMSSIFDRYFRWPFTRNK